MGYFDGKCKECGEDAEFYCDGDNPIYCPNCMAIDPGIDEGDEDE